jgi:PAS domain S-box-containing protein
MSGRKEDKATPDEWTQDLPQGSLFRTAFESSRTVMFLIDPETAKIVAANQAACEFYGYDPREVGGLPATEVSLLDDESLRQLLLQISAGGSIRFSSRHRLKDGAIRDMELDAAPITLSSGRSCLFFIGHDVTARHEAEEALRRSEGLLRAILDAAVDGIGYKDAEGVYREANQAFCRMVGKPCDDILGRKAGDFFDRRAASRHVEMDRRIMRGGEPVAYELVQERPGGPLYLSVHKSPVFDPEGSCLGVVSVSHDITPRRQAEDALKKSEGLLRAMLHSAQDTIFVTDEGDVLRELNQAFCELMCRSRKVLLGKHLSQVFTGDELRIQLSTNSLARETREPVSFTQHLRTDDQQRWVSVVKNAVLDAEGHCLGVVAMGRDITAQHLAEQALRQSERRLSGLIRQAPVGVFETDSKGLLVFANERMQRQTGRTQQALSGNGWIESIVPEDRQDFLDLWLDALEHKREVDRELRMLDARGVRQWMSCRIRPMTDAANRFSGFLGVIGDISERKKAEALRTDVESVVRHDLKSPLGSVQNAMELLELMGPLSREQAQVVNEVRILTRRMQDLISLSLDLHAMEAGAFSPSLGPVDLCEVVEAQRLELRTLVEGKGLKLSLVSECPQGPFFVNGERRLLDAVFSNLLKNAAEASPEGGEITVRLENEGPLAEVFIHNRGEVPKSIRERFFEKYATSGKPHGTGIGTYSARLMARTMGGTLSLNTEEPGCTTLILRLPTGDPAQVDLMAPPACPSALPD